MKQGPDCSKHRVSLQLLLLAVFVLPSLVPTGYMVQRNAETALVEVVICSGVNHRTAWLDVDSGTYLPDGMVPVDEIAVVETVQSESCPFAVTGLADFSWPVQSIPESATQAPVFFSSQKHLAGQIRYLPPVRGPPALS